jgi:hypothetical protein
MGRAEFFQEARQGLEVIGEKVLQSKPVAGTAPSTSEEQQ